MDWRELWPLAGSADFISLDYKERLAHIVKADARVAQVAAVYHGKLAEFHRMTPPEWETFRAKWVGMEVHQRSRFPEGDIRREKTGAFYEAVHAEDARRLVAAAKKYVYEQEETDAGKGD